MAKRKRTRGVRGAGTITQLPGGQWRLRVTLGGRQVDYGFYPTEELAGDAQARWRLTHLLPEDDPQQVVGRPASDRCCYREILWIRGSAATRPDLQLADVGGHSRGEKRTASHGRQYRGYWTTIGDELPPRTECSPERVIRTDLPSAYSAFCLS
jgi:hypothetical protein